MTGHQFVAIAEIYQTGMAETIKQNYIKRRTSVGEDPSIAEKRYRIKLDIENDNFQDFIWGSFDIQSCGGFDYWLKVCKEIDNILIPKLRKGGFKHEPIKFDFI